MDALDQQNLEGSERTEWVVEVKPGDYQSHNKKRHCCFYMTNLESLCAAWASRTS